MTILNSDIENLEEEIKENIEWLSTTRGEETESISIENLESLLTRFFNKPIKLSI